MSKIKIYTAPSCSSCRKVKEWFKKHKIPFEEINLTTAKLTKQELLELLAKTDDGIYDIVSLRTEIGKNNAKKIEKMTINELIAFVIENPTILKRPIIVGERSLQVGYSEEDVERFMLRDQREAFMRKR